MECLPRVAGIVFRHGEELLLVIPHFGQLAVRPPLPEIENELVIIRVSVIPGILKVAIVVVKERRVPPIRFVSNDVSTD